jgi:hypothetical protein
VKAGATDTLTKAMLARFRPPVLNVLSDRWRHWEGGSFNDLSTPFDPLNLPLDYFLTERVIDWLRPVIRTLAENEYSSTSDFAHLQRQRRRFEKAETGTIARLVSTVRKTYFPQLLRDSAETVRGSLWTVLEMQLAADFGDELVNWEYVAGALRMQSEQVAADRIALIGPTAPISKQHPATSDASDTREPEDPVAKERQMIFAEYRSEVLQKKGIRLTQAELNRAAGYKNRSTFEAWIHNTPRKATKDSDRAFRRVLLEEKPHLK